MRTRTAVVATAVAAVVAVGVAVAVVAVRGESRPAPFDAWPDSTFGAVVVDQRSGAVRYAYAEHEQFRSASLVKLLIAIDVLERPAAGPAAEQERALVASMLRVSDDDAASVLWARHGAAAIVSRTAAQLGLTGTEPPAARSSWGYTAVSAADVARVYRYLLTDASPAVRDTVLGHLRATSRCAVDGRDQLFGVPHDVAGPWPVKQGWSGFGELPAGTGCTPAPASAVDPAADDRARLDAGPAPDDTGSDPEIDTSGPLVHTSGVVGDRDPVVVVVLSLHPDGTTFDEATRRLDDAVRALLPRDVPVG